MNAQRENERGTRSAPRGGNESRGRAHFSIYSLAYPEPKLFLEFSLIYWRTGCQALAENAPVLLLLLLWVAWGAASYAKLQPTSGAVDPHRPFRMAASGQVIGCRRRFWFCVALGVTHCLWIPRSTHVPQFYLEPRSVRTWLSVEEPWFIDISPRKMLARQGSWYLVRTSPGNINTVLGLRVFFLSSITLPA